MNSTPWTPSDPLRADATREQMAMRFTVIVNNPSISVLDAVTQLALELRDAVRAEWGEPHAWIVVTRTGICVSDPKLSEHEAELYAQQQNDSNPATAPHLIVPLYRRPADE